MINSLEESLKNSRIYFSIPSFFRQLEGSPPYLEEPAAPGVWSYTLKLTGQQDKEPYDLGDQGAVQISSKQRISVLNLNEREINIYLV